jgi:hypothetical protein
MTATHTIHEDHTHTHGRAAAMSQSHTATDTGMSSERRG